MSIFETEGIVNYFGACGRRDSLLLHDNDTDDMVVFGAMRDAFSCGWLSDCVCRGGEA